MAAGEVLAPGSCGVVAVGGALEPGGRTAVGAVESLLTSPCFRKGLRAAVVMEHAGRHHYLFTGASQMGRRSCSPWPESAWGRVMMAPPVDVAGLRPRLGRCGGSSEAEVESVFQGRGRARAPGSGEAEVVRQRPGQSPSPRVGRSGVRRLPGLSPSPSPGSGGAEFAVFRG